MNPNPIRVAVIGAGFSGLVAARELQRENHDVVVFEKSDRIGGTWIYSPRTETDPMSLDPTREILHSSMYDSLRTNLPRHLMGFSDYPMTPRGDPRTFPGREEVLGFLNGFATDFDLIKLVRFGSEVVRVEKAEKGATVSCKWAIEWRSLGTPTAAASTVEVFEAVVVCNGHNTYPRIAEFPGRSHWPGKQVHSHNYRIPDPYKDQIVVVIGNGPSAMDISSDILPFAKQVHQSSRTKTAAQNQEQKSSSAATVVQHPMIQCAEEDGKLVFEDGSSIYADVILHCTGYCFRFPFLRSNDDIVTVDNNRVGPLYKHVFPPNVAPSLSFIGLNDLGVTPVLFELQSKWVARVLSGKMSLPDEEEMMASIEEHYKQMENMGWPKHHTHRLQKHDYERWLAEILELPPLEKWREEMFLTLFTLKDKYGDNRLDKWDADKWLQQVINNNKQH